MKRKQNHREHIFFSETAYWWWSDVWSESEVIFPHLSVVRCWHRNEDHCATVLQSCWLLGFFFYSAIIILLYVWFSCFDHLFFMCVFGWSLFILTFIILIPHYISKSGFENFKLYILRTCVVGRISTRLTSHADWHLPEGRASHVRQNTRGRDDNWIRREAECGFGGAGCEVWILMIPGWICVFEFLWNSFRNLFVGFDFLMMFTLRSLLHLDFTFARKKMKEFVENRHFFFYMCCAFAVFALASLV